MNQKNIFFQKHIISRKKRELSNKHNSKVLWFTGLSGSGKSTIAGSLENILYKQRIKTYLLDGDNLRLGLCSDLAFSNKDRTENVRRVAEVSKLMLEAGLVVLCALITPYEKDRIAIKNIIGVKNYIEIFVDTPFEICKLRDPKGLYKQNVYKKIDNFTGFDSSYEPPKSPDLHINGEESLEIILKKIFFFIKNKIFLKNVN
ncbi:adenylyl-sulfate kinase [Buchnera aphidicola (Mindarus keteleerifoliae)]|uniref:adenylyl-sulfate kinase n=1 Tax=Buchnera aphidicola TaxID=9 RepID=UPI0031B7045D